MQTRRTAGALAVAALLAGFAGCGSAGGGSSIDAATTSASGLSRGELAAKANAICAAVKSAARSIPSSAGIGSDAPATAAYFGRVTLIVDQALKALRALTPAAGAATAWQAFVSAEVAVDELLRTLTQKALASDPSGIGPLYRHPPAYQRFSDAASKIGATGCR